MEKSVEEHNRSSATLFMSALAAGMEVGFSVFAMGVLYTLFAGQMTEEAMHFMLAFAYPVGFIFVIIGRSELFTEHTTLAVLPVLSGRVKKRQLARFWGTVLTGNLIGGYVMSLLLVFIGPRMETISYEAFYELAHKMISYKWYTILTSAILAGWLMGLLSWLITSAQETISRILMIILVTAMIGVLGLHHSIVGSIEVFTGLITSDEIGLADYVVFQVLATLGNLIGGVVFVAIIKYGQIERR